MKGERMKKRPAGNHSMGPMGGMGRPVEKPKNFKGTFKRLLGYLKPRSLQLVLVFIFAVLSTIFSILSPKIMGQATTKLFEGLMLKLKHVPGAHIDFAYIQHIVFVLIGLYVASALFAYIQQYIMAGVAQKTVYDLRQAISRKLSSLPLKFFDSHSHGEILSRVTNDIDNIAATLQQSLTQFITSVVTLLGIIVMMLTISPMLTLITLITLPLYALVTSRIASRSQTYFAAQQKSLGELNGHVEEMFTGHQVVKAFGHEQESIEEFKTINQKLYQAGWKAQFISGIIMPLMTFIGNIGYVLICVVGGIM
ncbi:MAG: ABC transporter ATP-binding protein, partial [Syntrophomonadaceae bacterium]|nr:ABC transporter ATP-binding protein [Syntrophomonadaceae bacterium]